MNSAEQDARLMQDVECLLENAPLSPTRVGLIVIGIKQETDERIDLIKISEQYKEAAFRGSEVAMAIDSMASKDITISPKNVIHWCNIALIKLEYVEKISGLTALQHEIIGSDVKFLRQALEFCDLIIGKVDCC